MMVAAASGDISEQEIEALDGFLGEGTVTGKLSLDALRADLGSRVNAARAEAPVMRRAQLVRDLCVIAIADGHSDSKERAVMVDLAKQLEVDPALVEQTLEAKLELD